jgi:hypothetical protein
MLNPSGLCLCGCGGRTQLAKAGERPRGYAKGDPLKYIHGHNQGHQGRQARPVGERFWSKVNKAGPVPDYAPHLGRCWLWTGYLDPAGYGGFSPGTRKSMPGVRAHRWAYQDVRGPIPDDLPLDHLCRVRSCVNPAHLDPVTIGENCRRGAAVRTHCPHGHPYSGDNLYITRQGARACRECGRQAVRRRRARLRAVDLDAEIEEAYRELRKETG